MSAGLRVPVGCSGVHSPAAGGGAGVEGHCTEYHSRVWCRTSECVGTVLPVMP